MPYSKEEEEILAFLRSEHESYYRGDFEAFIEHWHHGPEVRRIVSGTQVGTRIHRGWQELLPRFKEGFRKYPQNVDARESLRWENIQIQVAGDMAWIAYDQVLVRNIPGIHAPPLSHEVKIVQRFDGDWKLVCLTVQAPGIGREDVPLIELDADGKLVGVNTLASERLKSHRGLILSGNRVKARNRAFDTGLQTAIQWSKDRLATNLPRGFQEMLASVVPLGEDVAGNPLFCWVTPEQERVLISFDDQFLLRGRLKKAAAMFGLSPAQLALAELLASGYDLVKSAEELEVSVNTLRTQARRMFEKTNTHNQVALVSRLLNIHGPD